MKTYRYNDNLFIASFHGRYWTGSTRGEAIENALFDLLKNK
jgi:hypothetical protein